MGKFISLSKAWIKKIAESSRSVDISLSGPRIKIPLSMSEFPLETRQGYDASDKKTQFYESNLDKLYGYYYAYRNSHEHIHELLYAEIIAIAIEGYFPVSRQRVDRDKIRVSLDAVDYRLPTQLKEHGAKAIKLFQEIGRLKRDKNGEWENNRTPRIVSFSSDGNISCCMATYFDQVSTNITLDWASGALEKGCKTLRSSLEFPQNGRLPSLESSHLANTLGTAVMFYDLELKPIIRVRSPNMGSIGQGGLHCTVSGVLEFVEDRPPGEYGFELFEPGTREEIRTETGLLPHQYHLFPVAFARELPRGGKPQIFWAAISLIDADSFKKSCAEAEESSEYILEKDGFDFAANIESAADFLSKFTYEGRASEFLADAFIRANREKILKLLTMSS